MGLSFTLRVNGASAVRETAIEEPALKVRMNGMGSACHCLQVIEGVVVSPVLGLGPVSTVPLDEVGVGLKPGPVPVLVGVASVVGNRLAQLVPLVDPGGAELGLPGGPDGMVGEIAPSWYEAELDGLFQMTVDSTSLE